MIQKKEIGMRNKLLLLLVHVSIFCTMLVMQSHASSITPGYNAMQIQRSPHVLHDGEIVQGLVRINNGLTVIEAATGTMDTRLSVSGAIDLRDTGILQLLGDLYLDANVTLSGGGNIKAHDNTIFMSGDLTLPPSKTLNFTNNAVIDGRGHDLIIDTNSQISLDSAVSVTLKNMTIKNKRNGPKTPPIILDATTSQLTLDDVIMAPVNDFNFLQGQLFIKNDVIFTGTSALVYKSTMPCRIAQNSCLYFDTNTTFSYAPESSNKDLIVMTDPTSTLYLDGCDLKTTYTGLRLTTGRLICDNKINFETQAGLTLNLDTQITPTYSFGSQANSVSWSPNGQYLAVGGYGTPSGNELQIFYFNGSSLTFITGIDFGATIYSVNWNSNGNRLVVGGSYLAPSGKQLRIYSFAESTLTLLDSKNFSSSYSIKSTSWSSDNNFLAVSDGYNIIVYSFDGTTLTSIDSKIYGNIAQPVNWSPDDQYLAVGGGQPESGNELQVYSFNGATLSLTPVAVFAYGYRILSLNWSPDGQYLAIGGQSPNEGHGELEIYSFDGSTLTLIPGTQIHYGLSIWSVNWSHDGQYLAIGGITPTTGHEEIEVYSFDGTTLTSIIAQNYGTILDAVNWSIDDNFLAVGGMSPAAGHNQAEVYPVRLVKETQTQTMNNTLIFGNKNLGSAYNLQTTLLSGCNIEVNGLLNDDSV